MLDVFTIILILRFEIYALQDIKENEEITFRYDSINYRKVIQI